MKRRSLIKGLLALPGVLRGAPLDGLLAFAAEKSASRLERIQNEFILLLPGEKEMLAQPIRANRISMESASIDLQAGDTTKTIKVGETSQGWKLLTILPWHNGFTVAVLEKHATHQGVIAFVTAERELARIPKQIGDLSQIKPRLHGVQEAKFKRPEKNAPRPDTVGQYILASDEDPSYENIAALGPEYTGWTLVSDEGVGPRARFGWNQTARAGNTTIIRWSHGLPIPLADDLTPLPFCLSLISMPTSPATASEPCSGASCPLQISVYGTLTTRSDTRS